MPVQFTSVKYTDSDTSRTIEVETKSANNTTVHLFVSSQDDFSSNVKTSNVCTDLGYCYNNIQVDTLNSNVAYIKACQDPDGLTDCTQVLLVNTQLPPEVQKTEPPFGVKFGMVVMLCVAIAIVYSFVKMYRPRSRR